MAASVGYSLGFPVGGALYEVSMHICNATVYLLQSTQLLLDIGIGDKGLIN